MPDETKPNGTPPEVPPTAEKPTAEKPTVESKPPSPSPPVSAAVTPATPPAAAAAPKPPAPPPKPAGPVPMPWDDEFTQSLKNTYGPGIREGNTYLGQKYLVVEVSILTEILTLMREDEGFDYLVDVTAVHYPKREKAEFDIVYILYSFAKNTRIRVKTQIADGASVASVVSIWPTANWLEREVFDMFGIR